MNIYKISQTENDGYDTFDSAVVIAKNEKDAQIMSPYDGENFDFEDDKYSWASCVENVKVEYIGVAGWGLSKGVVCASFNAG